MQPKKVKKELQDYADIIKIFGPDSTFVKEKSGQAAWTSRVPQALLQDLDKLTGWKRCEDQKHFSISMPADLDDILLPDSLGVACLETFMSKPGTPKTFQN